MSDNIIMNDRFSDNKADYLLSVTAVLQSSLAILQLFLMDALYMDAESANRIRVMATAIPIILSMVIVLKRKFTLTLIVYAIVVAILFFTTVIYPSRWIFMRNDVFKFTLPVIIPTGLCIASVNNFRVFIKCLQYVSLVGATIGLLYALFYLRGGFTIDSYSMAFSYSLMFPTFVMLSKKKIVWRIIGVILMIEMLAIGSRGALLISFAYFIFTMIWGKMSLSKMIVYAVALIIAYLLLFNVVIENLASLFDSIGINSRTLRLLLNDELISHDSGRDYLAEQTWALINNNPLFGNGVWADREVLGIYCHNVFLEILLDFGYIGAGVIFISFFVSQIRVFMKLPMNHKTMFIMMLSVLAPLVVSSSYLISYNVGMFLGFSYLQSHLNTQRFFQDYEYE